MLDSQIYSNSGCQVYGVITINTLENSLQALRKIPENFPGAVNMSSTVYHILRVERVCLSLYKVRGTPFISKVTTYPSIYLHRIALSYICHLMECVNLFKYSITMPFYSTKYPTVTLHVLVIIFANFENIWKIFLRNSVLSCSSANDTCTQCSCRKWLV